MSIPTKCRPTGFDSWYVRLQRDLLQLLGSSEKFELAWIAPEKKLIIHTDRVDADVLAEVSAIAAELVPSDIEVVQYNHNMEISWKDINKYALCTNRQDVEAVNPDYRNDLTSDGEWVYPMPNLTTITEFPLPWFFQGSPMTEIDIELPKLTFSRYMCRSAGNLKKARVSIPNLTSNQRSFFEGCPLEELYVYAPRLTNLEAFITWARFSEITEDMIVHGNITNLRFFGNNCPNLWRVALNLDYVTIIDSSFKDSPKFSSFECDLPSLTSGSNAFQNAILNKESVLRITNTIPSYSSGTHRLGLGIHIDHQNDPEVLAAIANAEAKGWTLTVRWNPGGPTYTTPAT